MNLFERSILDNRTITQNVNGFSVPITLIPPTGSNLIVRGIPTRHHNAFDEDGVRISSKIASVSISMDQLTTYTYRNANGDVFMDQHKLKVTDSTGTENTYRITEWFPDEALNLLTLMLASSL